MLSLHRSFYNYRAVISTVWVFNNQALCSQRMFIKEEHVSFTRQNLVNKYPNNLNIFEYIYVFDLIEKMNINTCLFGSITSQLQSWEQDWGSHQVFILAWQSLPILTSNQEHKTLKPNVRNMTTLQNEKSHNNFSTKRTREQIIEQDLTRFYVELWEE